jgi:D-alanyl-D-alanine carboxypeptidase
VLTHERGGDPSGPEPVLRRDNLGGATTPTTVAAGAGLHPQTILRLQQSAGNAAVARLVATWTSGARSRIGMIGSVQRVPLSAGEDPERYTEAAGRKDVASSGTTRLEVHDLKFGVSGGFQSTYEFTSAHGKKSVHQSSELQMTKESPDRMAVVIMPDQLTAKEVQVVLHFHGYGFRGDLDPYAGYTVASGRKGGTPASRRGTVRDVDQEHWEQQIGEVNRERARSQAPPVIAILAQGRGPSQFGGFPTFDYVEDVLTHIGHQGMPYSLVLSGHSAGGVTEIAPRVERGDAQTADRARLPTQTPRRAPSTAPMQPTDLVILFDAEGIERVMDRVTNQIRGLVKTLRSAATADDARAAIAATPKFRGYFAEHGSYATRYTAQNHVLCKELGKVPEKWTCLDPGDPAAIKVPDLFRIIQISGVDHEHVISGGGPAQAGSLKDALSASRDPTSDREKAYGCSLMEACGRRAPSTPGTGKPLPPGQRKAARMQRTLIAIQRDDATPSTASKPGSSGSWRVSDATSQYSLTEDEKKLLASQTPGQRADDRAKLDRKATRRIVELAKARKKGPLGDDEEKELADLLALKERIDTAQRALKRKDVEEVLARAGPYTVAQWFGDIQKGTFLGLSLRVHRALADRLTRAEASLVADATVNPSSLNAKDLGRSLGMYGSTSDLRPPAAAVGGTRLSLHTFGLAVDLNYTGNPFMGLAGNLAPDVVRRATSLVNGAAIDVMARTDDPKAAYGALRTASEALKTYLSYRDPANRAALDAKVTAHAAVKGEPTDATTWIEQIEKDHVALGASGDFTGHKPPEEGFIDLNEAVVLALTGAGLTWGGTYPGAKDIMHFDLRQGEGAKVDAARKAHADTT